MLTIWAGLSWVVLTWLLARLTFESLFSWVTSSGWLIYGGLIWYGQEDWGLCLRIERPGFSTLLKSLLTSCCHCLFVKASYKDNADSGMRKKLSLRGRYPQINCKSVDIARGQNIKAIFLIYHKDLLSTLQLTSLYCLS